MKESSCHDLKMEAYYNAVRRLEDKFDGLEHNHVPCKHNEDADELAKIASERTTVPPNIFAHGIAKPSVNFKESAKSGASPTEPSNRYPSASETDDMEIETVTFLADEAEEMQIDEAPLLQDWRDQYLD